MSDAAVGIIANPAAGKDIRRLVSSASPVSDMAKIGIIRRAAIGAVEGGATRLVLADDRHSLARRAVEGAGLPVEILDLALFSSGRDSQRAAQRMAECGLGAVIVLGGDGTHRDVAKGWRDAPIVALSTGTNNVFPRAHEATVAGHAAGLVACGAVPIEHVVARAKVIDVEIEGAGDVDGVRDLSLVDVALTADSFIGSRAVWDVRSLRDLVAVIAEPASVGLSAIAAAVEPVRRSDPGGVHLLFGPNPEPGPGSGPDAGHDAEGVRCPIAPGLYADVMIAGHRRLSAGDVVELVGPGVLGFDGERDVVLAEGRTALARIAGDGPRVIDVDETMGWGRQASALGCQGVGSLMTGDS